MLSLGGMADIAAVYRLPGAEWSLQLSASSAKALQARRQKYRWSSEAVGQLYSSDLTTPEIVINEVSSLTSRGSAVRATFDLQTAKNDRAKAFARGLHCVGIWHTHPEPHPRPSSIDLELACDYAAASAPVLSGLIFIIVGITERFDHWFVGVHDGTSLRRAVPMHRTSQE